MPGRQQSQGDPRRAGSRRRLRRASRCSRCRPRGWTARWATSTRSATRTTRSIPAWRPIVTANILDGLARVRPAVAPGLRARTGRSSSPGSTRRWPAGAQPLEPFKGARVVSTTTTFRLPPHPLRPRPGGDHRGAPRHPADARAPRPAHPADEGGADQGSSSWSPGTTRSWRSGRAGGGRQGRVARPGGGRGQGRRHLPRTVDYNVRTARRGAPVEPHDRRSPRADVGAVPDVPGAHRASTPISASTSSRGRSSSWTSRWPRSPRSAPPRPSCSASSSRPGSRTPSALGFTILGALVLALTRSRERHVSQEAVIGVVYAVSSAAAVLLADRTPHGAEHLRGMLVGSILSVRGARGAEGRRALRGASALFHWLCRRPFFLISTDPDRAYREGWRVRGWDFLFYASFGVVVTSSVRIAGVLLVFSYLIVPALAGHPAGRQHRARRLLIGWGFGTARERPRHARLGRPRPADRRDRGLRVRPDACSCWVLVSSRGRRRASERAALAPPAGGGR